MPLPGLLSTSGGWHVSTILRGILAPAFLHDLFQAACSLEVLVLCHQLLPLCFTALQEEGLLALLHSCSLLSLRTWEHCDSSTRNVESCL